MDRFGFLSIIVGIMIIIAYSVYTILGSLEVPFLIKSAITLIVLGVVVVIVKQISDRKKEIKENEEYKDY